MAQVTKKVSNSKRRQIDALVEQSAKALNQARPDLCEQLCMRIDQIQPGNADAASMRGVIASRRGYLPQAVQLFRQAVAVAPSRCEFHANLAAIHLMQGEAVAALESYRRALALKPYQLQIQMGCASALVALSRFDEAVSLMQSAHKQKPRDTAVLMKLFHICHAADRMPDAEAALQQLLAIDPAHVEAHCRYGELLLEAGRKPEGEREIREVLRLDPDYADAARPLSVLKRYSECDADVTLLAGMYERSSEGSPEQLKLAFAYGKVLDDLGEYDAAFDCFAQGNAILAAERHYDQDQELAHLQMVMQTYTPAVVQQQAAIDDASPLFIVGMPHSGGALVEQLLGAHPDVAVRGECGCLEEALQRCSSQDAPLSLEAMADWQPEQWQALGQRYLELLHSDSATCYTDSTLSNIRLIGAIHCALPKARIIHVRRDPLDTCLSIYRNSLFGSASGYENNLGQLGYYYRMYLQLMQHWRDVLPTGAICEVEYALLVSDPETEMRKLLDYCGLEPNDACLQPDHGDLADAVAAWKHYEKQLQPLVKILGVTA